MLNIKINLYIMKIMVPYVGEPLVADLIVAVEQQLSVPAEHQQLFYKGQALQNFRERPLREFGVCNSNKIRCVGRKAFIVR